jgi:hypothetical protein
VDAQHCHAPTAATRRGRRPLASHSDGPVTSHAQAPSYRVTRYSTGNEYSSTGATAHQVDVLVVDQPARNSPAFFPA